jgi:hypothetical protein
LGTSGSVRVRSMPKLEVWARVVQTFWPLTTHSSPSFTARLGMPATSEPLVGSENSWHHTSSPVKIRRMCFSFSSSEP